MSKLKLYTILMPDLNIDSKKKDIYNGVLATIGNEISNIKFENPEHVKYFSEIIDIYMDSFQMALDVEGLSGEDQEKYKSILADSVNRIEVALNVFKINKSRVERYNTLLESFNKIVSSLDEQEERSSGIG